MKVCRGYLFVFCVAFIPLRTVEDAGPYKEKSTFLMRTSLYAEVFYLLIFALGMLLLIFLLPHMPCVSFCRGGV